MNGLQRAAVSLASVLVLAGLCDCASGPAGISDALRHGRLRDALAAYDRAKPDPRALQRIAALLLEQEAQARDNGQRAQALSALQIANPIGQRVLARLASRAPDAVTRARALGLLTRFGDETARAALLTKLNDSDNEVRAVAVEALDPIADALLLRELCAVSSASVRLAAVRKLGRAEPSPDSLLLLARVARLDPTVQVRLAALDALSSQGPAAADAIEERLDDVVLPIRLNAVSALARIDYERALLKLARYLVDNPTPEGIEAARALLSMDAIRAPATARVQLEHALTHHDNALRAAAAVALISLRDAQLMRAAEDQAKHEAVRSVRLSLALALGSDQASGRALLTQLLSQKDVVSTEAAAELARRGDAQALFVLQNAVQDRDPLLRRIAVRALAADLGRGHDVRAALLDPDPSVRIAAAGAILAGVRAGQS
jgi:HEAT repeat protein